MKNEIEAKFLNVDVAVIRRRLIKAGAVCEMPMRLMRRSLIEPQEWLDAGRRAFIRIRDEGDRTMVTFKERKDDTINGTYEIETEVGDFETAIRLFAELGYIVKSYQESKRETWRLGPAEIVIDEWPWLAPYVEVEAETEQQVKDAAEKVGFGWSDHSIGGIKVAVIDQYPNLSGRGFIDLEKVQFGDKLPTAFGKARY